MKEDLIKLFEKTCSNFSVSRKNERFEVDVDCDTFSKIKDFLPAKIYVPGAKKPFEGYCNCPRYFTGFKFDEEPPIVIGTFSKTYKIKYGYFFPIISFAFWNNYINRKKYYNFIKKNWNAETDCSFDYDTLEKTIEFEKRTRFMMHGSIVAEISFKEYNKLMCLYKEKIGEYDLFKLRERLKKD